MSSLPNRSIRPLPLEWQLVGSVFAVGHLLAIGLLALEAQSGPWQTPVGVTTEEGPLFAKIITGKFTFPYYLQPLRMTHNYHFVSNQHPMLATYFEVKLKNELGEVTHTLKFPDERANFWVRHRQSILAQGLAEDQPVQPGGTEVIPAPHQKMPIVEIWEPTEANVLKLKEIPEYLIRDLKRQVYRPSPWSKALAQSYLRYLCREHKAPAAELIRTTRQAVYPALLFTTEPWPAGTFDEIQSHFGEYRRERDQ